MSPIAVSLSLDEELTGLPMRRKTFAGQTRRGRGLINTRPYPEQRAIAIESPTPHEIMSMKVRTRLLRLNHSPRNFSF